MNENKDLQFVDTDVEKIKQSLIDSFQEQTGRTLYPADPARLLLMWAAGIIAQERVLLNAAAKFNLPQYSEGKYMDALAELFKGVSRQPAAAATTTIRFYLSEKLEEAQLIPAETRVATDNGTTFETTESIYIAAGEIAAEATAVCQTVGMIGNGLLPGQITKLVDVFPYYDHCENITTSSGGAEVETDDSLYQRMRASEDTYSTAGPMGGYEYFAKSTNPSITDVRAITPSAGCVTVYPLMTGGALPGTEILSAVAKKLSASDVRPLTDKVTVSAPDKVVYNIDITYYIPSESSKSAAAIEADVADAVDKYKAWQSEKLGRDVNPSKLIDILMDTGIKRVVVRSPAFATVNDGKDNEAVEVAAIGTESVICGGYEDE